MCDSRSLKSWNHPGRLVWGQFYDIEKSMSTYVSCIIHPRIFWACQQLSTHTHAHTKTQAHPNVLGNSFRLTYWSLPVLALFGWYFFSSLDKSCKVLCRCCLCLPLSWAPCLLWLLSPVPPHLCQTLRCCLSGSEMSLTCVSAALSAFFLMLLVFE